MGDGPVNITKSQYPLLQLYAAINTMVGMPSSQWDMGYGLFAGSSLDVCLGTPIGWW